MFLAAVLHGVLTILISGTLIGGIANALVIISIITFWNLSIRFIGKFNKLDDDNIDLSGVENEIVNKKRINNSPKNFTLLASAIIVTVVGASVVMVFADQFILYPLYFGSFQFGTFKILWEISFPFNLLNISINFGLFLFFQPIINSIFKQMER